MTKKSMELIEEAGGHLGLEIKPREEYSGKGMYDRQTCAIVCDDIGDFVAAVAQGAINLFEENPQNYTGAANFIEDMRGLRTDSMGLGIVVY